MPRRHLPELVAASLCAVIALAIAWQLGWFAHAPPRPIPPPAKVWHHPHAFTVPQGWVKLKAGDAFTFYAPQGTVLAEPGETASAGHDAGALPGRDTYIGHVNGPGFALRFDYGAFDDDLSFAQAGKDTLEEALRIDGRDANIVTARDLPRGVSFAPGNPWFAGLIVPRVVPAVTYYGLSGVVWDRLRFFGYAKTEADAQIVRTILTTVEFTAPPVQ